MPKCFQTFSFSPIVQVYCVAGLIRTQCPESGVLKESAGSKWTGEDVKH